jgi:hypothetical protein
MSFIRPARTIFAIGILSGSFFFAHSVAAQSSLPFEKDKKIYKSCVTEFRNFPKNEVISDLTIDEAQYRAFLSVDLKLIDLLGEKILKSRFQTFNTDYQVAKNLVSKLRTISESSRVELNKQPLTIENKIRADLELKVAYHERTLRTARMKLLLQSLACNSDLLEALKTLSPSALAQLKQKDVVVPKLPGRYGGSRWDREKKKADEKLNLTPVDPEFYETQTGKKLEKDLGGKADFWSYDYQRDELYVKVGEDIGKIMVVPNSDGYRYIRTRTGPNFDQAKPDERVDTQKAEGVFLTGDKSQESLWGKMPSKGPKLLDETGPTHSKGKGDGHDHDH